MRLSSSGGLPMRPPLQLLQSGATKTRLAAMLRLIRSVDVVQTQMRFAVIGAQELRPMLVLGNRMRCCTYEQTHQERTNLQGHLLKI